MNKPEITSRLRECDFSVGDYVVISGAALAMRGIREAADIDIVVSPKLFCKLKVSSYWQLEEHWDTLFLTRDNIEIAERLDWDGYSTTFREARSDAEIIDGIPVMSLKDLREFKRAMRRSKDERDIMLINKYLTNQ